MAYANKPLQPVSITAPGFFGLNNQDSGISMNPSFALTATNAVIDRYGRIGARKGWAYTTTSGGTSSNPEVMFEFNNNGTATIISAGNNKIFTGETTMTQATVRNSTDSGNLTYTITDNDWQIVQAQFESGLNLSPHAYLVQKAHPPLVYHKLGATAHAHTGSFGFQRVGDIGAVPPGYSTTTFMPNCALAAYGRLWVADIDADNLSIYYSVYLDTTDFSGSSSGVINLEQVVEGGQKIVALASHNNFLVVFLTNSIVLYSNANDLGSLQLADIIKGVGCVARDSVQNIGTDLIFLSNSGVRSLARTIQEKSAPVRDLSKNVRDSLLAFVKSEDLEKVRSVYYEPDAFYLLVLPSSGFTYCFDLRTLLEDGSSRVTFWNNIDPSSVCATKDRRLLIGKTNGIAKYDGYTDNSGTYIFSYYSPFIDFQSPSVTKVLKKIGVTVVGASNTTFDIRWAFDYQSNYRSLQVTTPAALLAEYGVGEYGIAEYSSSVFIDLVRRQLTGSGTVLQIGIDATINGKPLSLQKIDIYAVTGRTI